MVGRALGISLDGQYAPNIGKFVKPDEKIIVIAPEGREREAVKRISRIGYDNVAGYLEGGFEAWSKSGNTIQKYASVEAEDIKKMIKDDYHPYILDVRGKGEW